MIWTVQGMVLTLAVLQAGAAWELPGVDVRLAVQPDGTVEVTETIHVNFGPHPRRGIDRELPTVIVHPDIGPLSLDVHIDSVVRDAVVPVAYRVRRGPHSIALEIGDPDTTRTGEIIYQLRYTVRGALVDGMHRTSLRWPVVGGEWDASIFQVQAIVQLAGVEDASRVFADSRVGYFGDTGRAVDVQVSEPERIVYRLMRGLRAHEKLVIDASWPRTAGGPPGDSATASSARGRGTLLAVLFAALLAVAIVIRVARGRQARNGP